MDWRKIPSLPALRAFETAARLGSYSGAARELNVTHAAIAQHVRTLEDHFGCPLMERQGQSMRTTREGAELASALSEGFGTIAAAATALSDHSENRSLRIAATASFAENWLMPRIGGFWSAHPEIGLEIVPSSDLVDLRRDGFDLALRYGNGQWSGTDSVRLVNAAHTIVAASHILANPPTEMRALKDQHFLLVGIRREEILWLTKNSLPHKDLRITHFDTGALVLQAVRAGHGISVLPWAVVANDVKTGQLKVLFKEQETDLAYYAVTRPGHVSPRLRTFMRWLKAEAT